MPLTLARLDGLGIKLVPRVCDHIAAAAEASLTF
jgi:hypothetical protein